MIFSPKYLISTLTQRISDGCVSILVWLKWTDGIHSITKGSTINLKVIPLCIKSNGGKKVSIMYAPQTKQFNLYNALR